VTAKKTDAKPTKPKGKKEVKLKIPKSLAACADMAYEFRAERLEVQREATEIGEKEKLLKEHLINALPKGEASGVAGKVARASVVKEAVPRIEDEGKLRAAIKKNPKKWGALISSAPPPIDMAVLKAMFDEGNVPPGVGTFNIIKVSLTKV
jgi:hypothetical protein